MPDIEYLYQVIETGYIVYIEKARFVSPIIRARQSNEISDYLKCHHIFCDHITNQGIITYGMIPKTDPSLELKSVYELRFCEYLSNYRD